MSSLFGAMFDAHNDYEGSPFSESEDITPADELSSAVGEFLDADLRDQFAAVLAHHDENGLDPTPAAVDVLMAVVRSLDYTDEHHDTPDASRYALDAEQALRIMRRGMR